METKHVINMVGFMCPAELDEEFNKSYDETHISLNMKFRGLIRATRYRLVRPSSDAIVKEYPQYLTIYKFKDYSTFKTWDASPERAAARADFPSWVERGVEMLWRVRYESIKTWENTLPLSVITIVGTQCPPETETRFDTWYSEKHVPDLLKFRGLEGATRYKLADSGYFAGVPVAIKFKEYPKYLTFYYFKDVPTAEAYDISPERANTDWPSVKKEASVSLLWRAKYEPMRTWQR